MGVNFGVCVCVCVFVLNANVYSITILYYIMKIGKTVQDLSFFTTIKYMYN